MEKYEKDLQLVFNILKIVVVWVWWILFFLIFGSELTIVCLLLLISTKLDRNEKI